MATKKEKPDHPTFTISWEEIDQLTLKNLLAHKAMNDAEMRKPQKNRHPEDVKHSVLLDAAFKELIDYFGGPNAERE